MKKKLKLVIMISSILMSSLICFDLIERKIMLNKHAEVHRFGWDHPDRAIRLGRYNGCPVMYYEFEGDGWQSYFYYIDNFYFSIYDDSDIYLLKNNNLYNLKEAYDNGFINTDQVAVIYYRWQYYLTKSNL